jgi:hypothetical protein
VCVVCVGMGERSRVGGDGVYGKVFTRRMDLFKSAVCPVVYCCSPRKY